MKLRVFSLSSMSTLIQNTINKNVYSITMREILLEKTRLLPRMHDLLIRQKWYSISSSLSGRLDSSLSHALKSLESVVDKYPVIG